MARGAARMRGDGPVVFAQVTHDVWVREIADHVLRSWRANAART
jgi:urease accessory protein